MILRSRSPRNSVTSRGAVKLWSRVPHFSEENELDTCPGRLTLPTLPKEAIKLSPQLRTIHPGRICSCRMFVRDSVFLVGSRTRDERPPQLRHDICLDGLKGVGRVGLGAPFSSCLIFWLRYFCYRFGAQIVIAPASPDTTRPPKLGKDQGDRGNVN